MKAPNFAEGGTEPGGPAVGETRGSFEAALHGHPFKPCAPLLRGGGRKEGEGREGVAFLLKGL